MKKISAFIVSFVYLVAATGITLHQHFCMNQLVSISLHDSSNDPCSTCGMGQTEKNGCCKDYAIKVKIEQTQLVDAASILLIHPVVMATSYFPDFLPPINFPALLFIPTAHDPPWQSAIPIYKWNENFLI